MDSDTLDMSKTKDGQNRPEECSRRELQKNEVEEKVRNILRDMETLFESDFDKLDLDEEEMETAEKLFNMISVNLIYSSFMENYPDEDPIG